MSPLKRYSGITFPTTNLVQVYTPDSIVSNSAGLITAWNNDSGSGLNNIITFTAASRESNQNNIKGIESVPTTAIYRTITTNPEVSTFAFLYQRNCNTRVPITLGNAYLYYIIGGSNVFAAATSTSTLTINNPGSVSVDIANPLANLGQCCFIIIRYNAGNANYYLNNTLSNVTIAKSSTPTFTQSNHTFYNKISNVDSDKLIPCFSAYWNRELSNAECLSLSNYVYMISNRAVGDAPINTALISKKQAELGAL